MIQKKLESIFILLLFSFSSFLIITVESQNLNSINKNEENIGLSVNSIVNEEITLIVGSDETAVETGILAFINNLDDDIEIKKQNDILPTDSPDIIIKEQ
ncbi:MAG: hypothetical protein BAJALOKI3v1_750003 [Promethearchaeota archaeon]|nr:MAG: hypothetical protein BAJALOKI3v1_750003 [Candidatus Lokiarchaeota archaeon]